MTDVEAWQELADLYLSEMQLEHAKFCYEELILHAPQNYIYHLKYAEILYTLGDFVTARKYFAQSLELNKDGNLRALFGLNMCTVAVASNPRSKSEDKINNTELFLWSRKQIATTYQEKGNETMHSLAGRALSRE
mmetsp:Transcript_5027/g.12061  ORF Transcript_5027/g.12061 Transcript_5027/m.12061 type:complete len:135 (+) Transcript_5027:520-924(+)